MGAAKEGREEGGWLEDRAPTRLGRFYSGSAEGYQRLWAPELLHLSRRLVDRLPLEGRERILDAGTGVGSLLPELVLAAPGSWLMGIDVSEGMLARAPKAFALAAMDAARLAVKNDVFDVCILAFVLFHLRDPADGVVEAARVLKPGGHVGTITWGHEPSYPALDIWTEELDAHGAVAPGDSLMRSDRVDTPTKVHGLLRDAGFRSINSWTERYENTMTTDEFLSHRVGHGMSKMRFESLDDDARARCLERTRARVGRLDADGLTHRAEAVFAIAELSSIRGRPRDVD